MNARQRRKHRRSPAGRAGTVVLRAEEAGAFDGLTFEESAQLAQDLAGRHDMNVEAFRIFLARHQRFSTLKAGQWA